MNPFGKIVFQNSRVISDSLVLMLVLSHKNVSEVLAVALTALCLAIAYFSHWFVTGWQ
jgi:hypothetical protein